MAQNVFINVTVDPAATSKTDGNHVHSVAGGTSASGNLTVSLDNAVITTLAVFDSIMRAVRLRLIGGGLK